MLMSIRYNSGGFVINVVNMLVKNTMKQGKNHCPFHQQQFITTTLSNRINTSTPINKQLCIVPENLNATLIKASRRRKRKTFDAS